MRQLDGKVAMITGGGQGVGLGIATSLATQGVHVALVGRTSSKLASATATIESSGGGATSYTCDVKDSDAILRTVAEIASELGRIDVLVNNAQEVPLGTLLDVDDDTFLTGINSGPLATFRFMKACYPHLKKAGEGVIINLTSSVTRRWDMTGYGPYAAVKQAITSLTRATAAEWGVDGIRALAIAPHAASPGMQGWIEANPAEAEMFFQSVPLRRVGRCQNDIGDAVTALCGPEFDYLTGATIPLDGGQANFG